MLNSSNVGENPKHAALLAIKAAIRPAGILASCVAQTNYQRVWARDSVICGLAGVAARDDDIIDALGASVLSLARERGPAGQIPSNVASEKATEKASTGKAQTVDASSPPSYGGLAGRVDAGAWFIIGSCHYLHQRQDEQQADLLRTTIAEVLALYEAWELNARGLVNVPMSGGWADEYPLQGYCLSEQLLRIWALRLAAVELAEPGYKRRANEIQSIVEASYWIDPRADAAHSYHPLAYAAAQQEPLPHWMASLSPGGYQPEFDCLANGLAVMLGLGNAASRTQALAHGQTLAQPLLPAFAPVIHPGDPQWPALQSLSAHGFRNHPGEYHNGGMWPMVNGFWGLALCSEGKREAALALHGAIQSHNQQGTAGQRYYEYHSTAGPSGTPFCTWSAAGEVLLEAVIAGNSLLGLRPKL